MHYQTLGTDKPLSTEQGASDDNVNRIMQDLWPVSTPWNVIHVKTCHFLSPAMCLAPRVRSQGSYQHQLARKCQ